MCGRYNTATPAEDMRRQYEIEFSYHGFTWRPSWNIAPSRDVPIVTLEDGRRTLRLASWGFVPSWSKDPKGRRPINARGETVATNGMFRSAFRRRRCLVPADGWYEWQATAGGKVPHWIRPTSRPFAFAGLWETWGGGEAELVTCTIVTTDAAEATRHIHDRMPVVLERGEWEPWLAGTPEDAGELLRPYRGALAWHAVSRLVNSPKNDVPECTRPAQDGEGE